MKPNSELDQIIPPLGTSADLLRWLQVKHQRVVAQQLGVMDAVRELLTREPDRAEHQPLKLALEAYEEELRSPLPE